ncbi:MAG TPA: hypothetical protein ENO20_10445 [Bacteroides sp.]|nr:hypothetical protein [Bacteroides sp.]
MKKILVYTFILLAASLYGQAPEKIGYQAVMRDTSGTLLIDTKIQMQIQILQGSESGTVVYEETQKRKTNANGIISLEIGAGDVISGTIGTIDWLDGPYFIRTVIYPTDELSYAITATSQIVSVPYALYADHAENFTGDYNEQQGLAEVLAIDNNAHSQIKNVVNPTHPQDVVTKAYTDIVLWASGVIPLHFAGFITDIDGNVYTTIRLGTQTWMAENLRTTTLKDNSAISPVTADVDWAALTAPGYCWYGNVVSNSPVAVTCGALYNWHTVSSENLCPDGWHVPSQDDYNSLVSFVGGTEIAGGKLKENGTKHWNSPNTLATNLSGFTALPAGMRNADGGYAGIGNAALFWTSSEHSAAAGVCAVLLNNSGAYGEKNYAKEVGLSVRCVKD